MIIPTGHKFYQEDFRGCYATLLLKKKWMKDPSKYMNSEIIRGNIIKEVARVIESIPALNHHNVEEDVRDGLSIEILNQSEVTTEKFNVIGGNNI